MKAIFSLVFVGTITWGILTISFLTLFSIAQYHYEVSPSIPHGSDSQFYQLLDNFNTGTSRPCFASKDGKILAPCPIQVQEESYVKIAYNVITEPSHAFLPINLQANLTAWNAVWIVIKGAEGGEEILAEFTDCKEKVFPKKSISQYLGDAITTSWRAAVIPLADFDEIPDRSCIGRFSIVANSHVESGIGTVYVDEVALLDSTVLIDSFSDPERPNELGGKSGHWENPGSIVTPTYLGGVLELSYDFPVNGGSGGYWTKLRSTNLLALKDYLSLKVRRGQGGARALVEVIDCATHPPITHYAKLRIEDYLQEGITTNWQTVLIPLEAFVDEQISGDKGVNWNCIDQLALNLTGSGTSTVYFDDIKLLPAEALPYKLPLWIDHFNDCDDWNALNWRWYAAVGGAGTPKFTATPDPLNRLESYGCGYRFTYNIQDGQSGWAWSELKGFDASNYTYLEFYIKSKKDGEATRVYLRSRNTKQHPVSVVASKEWQRVALPLSIFKSHLVDLTDLSEVKFAFEEGIWQGEIYIDNIRFTKSTLFLPSILKPTITRLYLRNHTGGTVLYTVQSLGSKHVPPTASNPVSWGSFPSGEYQFSWFKLSDRACGNSGKRLFTEGYFEPPPMICIYR